MTTKIHIVSVLRAALVLCAAGSFSFVARAEQTTSQYAPVIEKYTQLLTDEMSKIGVVGLGVALVDDHGVIWARGFGCEDQERSIEVTTNTLFGIGSMTKVFTAAAVMQLHGRHALDIDQPVSKALPAFKIKSRFPNATPITLRNVLTHHAGIPGDMMATSENEDFRSYLPTVAEMHATFAPDYVDSYSNLGFCILGNAIEAVSRERYETYIQENIFKPCGMTVSRFNANTSGIPHLSRAYDDAKKPKADDHTSAIPAGAIFSSLDDMSRFLRAWLNHGRAANGVLLESNLVEQMFRVQNRDIALDLGHARGLCWDIEDGEAGRLFSHGGALVCFRSQMVVAPDCGLAAVMLVNSANGGGVTWRTKELLKEAAQIKGVSLANARKVADPIPHAKMAPLPAEKVPGIYAADFMHMEITRDGTNFITKIGNQTLKFLPAGNDSYKAQYKDGDSFNDIPGEEYYFSEVAGQALFLQHKWGSFNNGGSKIAASPIPADWQARLGKYHAIRESKSNWFNDAELTVQDGMLALVVPLSFINQTAPFQLQIDSKQMAHVPGMNRYSGNVLEFSNPGSTAEMVFMGVTMKKM